jgi:drug/metabolite transporter (DMT)-like permease
MSTNTPPLLYIVQAFLPLLTFIFWLAMFDGEFTYRTLAGVLLGLIGVIVMMTMGSVIAKSGKIVSLFLYLLCIGGWAYGMLLLRRKLTNISTISISSYSFYIMLVPALLFCMSGEVPEAIIKNETSRWGTFYSAILGIICVALGNYVFFRLVKKAGALFASTVTFLIPIFYFIFAFFDNDMFTERPKPAFFIGSGLIILGTFLTNKLDFDPTKKHRRKVNKYYYSR